MRTELNATLQQCLRNKEYGSIAKYWRERYLDAVERNAPDMELRQIIESMRAKAMKERETVIPGSSTVLLFEDHSATLLIPGPDGSTIFVTGGSDSNTPETDYATVAYKTSTGTQFVGEPLRRQYS